jgi:cytochrome c-type biogenesis protein CcmE
MAELGWTKANEQSNPTIASKPAALERLKYFVGGATLLGAVGILIFSGMLTGTRYFISVDELLADSEYVGQSVRITGAVVGSSIDYNSETLDLSFTVANIPIETTDLALILHTAVEDETATRLNIKMTNQVMPDLLQNEAQAILTGYLDADGNFYADSLLLKCPSRFGEEMPDAAAARAEYSDQVQ